MGCEWQRPRLGKTLLIITYDEHGGNYDHVHPPTGAIAPDGVVGSSGFDFTRFGVRVPAGLVSAYPGRHDPARARRRAAALRPEATVKTLRTAAEQYNFIQERRAACGRAAPEELGGPGPQHLAERVSDPVEGGWRDGEAGWR